MPIDATGGPFGGGFAQQVFAIGLQGGITPEQETARVTIDAQRREINRLRGYKPVLNNVEKAKLAEIQAQIIEIQTKSANGTVRPDELEDRLDLLKEADEIIGKPTTEVDGEDEKLAEYASLMKALLDPNLNPVQQKQLDRFERVKATLEEALSRNPESATIRSQFQNITRLIEEVNPPRAVSALSVSERKAYDDLAELINERAGAKIQLSARDTMRVAELENSIFNMQSQLPPDASQQPTSQQVSRAYMRLA